MPNFKLHYFGVSARGELIRLLFAVSGIDFEDVRINLEEWSALKEKTPLGLNFKININIIYINR